MREMKYSGVEWIGDIPEEWEVKPIRNILIERNEKNRELSITTILSLSAREGVSLYNSETHTGNKPREDLSDYKIVRKGDIVVNSMNILSGSVGISEYEGVVSPVYYIYYPRTNNNIRYFHLLFQCFEFQRSLRGLGNGILIRETESGSLNTIRIRIPSKKLGLQEFPYPSEKEQQAIADILDRKCTQIDALIANEEQQIAKLKAYKQSVITETVTKGLNPDVPMKYSGVEWIGEIPYTWSLKATKRLFVIESGATPKSDNPDNFDGDIVWITPADYTTEQVYITDSRRKLTELGLKTCSTSLIPPNSIIFSKRAPIGLVAINHVELCTNQGCLSCISKTNDLIKYYYYVMSIFTDQYNLLGSGTTFKEISLTSFSNFILPCPPVEEQQHIAEYLDQKCEQIDRLIAIKQQKIEKLQQYKKSLIYEYVTGKKEVI